MIYPITKGWICGYFLTLMILSINYSVFDLLISSIGGLLIALLLFFAEWVNK